MSYSEKELSRVLVKLSSLISAKIQSSNGNPDSGDFDFLTQVKVYLDSIPKNSPKVQNDNSRIQTKLRVFLKKANPWEKMKTSISDVSIIKVPIKKQKIATLRLVLNHMKKEFDIKDGQTFQKLKGVFADSRVNSLIKEIDQINKMRIRSSN